MEYISLTRYLIFFAAFFDAKMEYMQRKKRLRAIHKILKEYGDHPVGKKVFCELADRKRPLQIHQWMWKAMIRIFSFGMKSKWYLLMSVGVKILITQKVDERLSDTGIRE